MHYEIYRDATGEWRWRLIASNHRIVACSGEGYHNRADCLWGLALSRGHAAICASIYEAEGGG